MKKAAVLTMCILATAGCDTRRVDPSAAQASQDIYSFGRPSAPTDARIVFTQDAGALSCFGAGMSVYLDDQLAAETTSGKQVTLYHPPGPTQLSIRNNAKCAGGDLRGLLLDLKAKHSYQVRGYRGTWDKAEPLLTTPAPYVYK